MTEYRVFLSHSSHDEKLANVIAQQIEKEVKNSLKVFVSSRAASIPSGVEWEKDVISNLDQAEVLVFLMTGHSENSTWVGCELGYFWKKSGKKLIHTLRHPTAKVPSPLDTLQAKSVISLEELGAFFRGICHDLGKDYEGNSKINEIVDEANRLVLKPPERSLGNFEHLLENSEWEIFEFDGKEIWLCTDDLLFQIIGDDDDMPFEESWTKRIYSGHEPKKRKLKLKLGGVTIKEVYFVGLDEWRYFVPIPAYKMVDARSDDYQLYWKRSSLEFKLMKRIGRFYPVYPTIESFAQKCEIEIID